jgi:very-short-patch-repair endonuclease
VDFLWRERRLAVEIDGYRFHSTARRFEHDRRKDAALHAAGPEVRRFTFWQVQDAPLLVVAGVTRGL